MKCKQCGSIIKASQKFCPNCGTDPRRMFANIFDFEYTRNLKQLFGFAFVHYAIILGICFFAGYFIGLIGAKFNINGYINFAHTTGIIINVVYVLCISILIISKRQLLCNETAIILALIGCIIPASGFIQINIVIDNVLSIQNVILSILRSLIVGGTLSGCILPAILTTFKAQE